MRAVRVIALNDLLISLKARETFLIGLLMPALMMLLLGVAMGGADSEGSIVVDVLDWDGSDLSAQFVSTLQDEVLRSGRTFVICPYQMGAPDKCNVDKDIAQKPGEWQQISDKRLKDTDAFGALIIDPGFGEKLRAGDAVSVQFKSSASLSAPTLAQQTIEAAISRTGSSVAIANLTIKVAEEKFGALPSGSPERAAAFETLRTQAESAWQQRPVQVKTQATKKSPSTLGFNQSGPGIALMFVFMFMLNASSMLVYEREQGTLQRLYTLPVRKGTILAGKILGRYVYGLGIFVMLLAAGTLMGVQWGGNGAGIVLLMLVFTLTSTALGLALATIVRTSAQASNISTLLGLTLAPLGGAWWPLEIVPKFMKVIGHISPLAWGMDAFQKMMLYNGSVIDILPMLGVLLAMAAAFFAFGVFNFKYE
jgi:ABC-2 type transport system permease protein